MSGFMNFIVVFGVIGTLVWAFRRWTARKRDRTRLTEMGEDTFAEAVSAVSRNANGLPQSVLEGVAFMTFVLRKPGEAESFLEAAFVVERTAPTDEGELVFADPVDREAVVAAGAAMMGLLFLRDPRRWKPYAAAVKADETLPARAAVAGAAALLFAQTRREGAGAS